MQPIDRDTQIKLMTNARERHEARVRELLAIPRIAAAAKRCAFEEARDRDELDVRVVRYVRTA